MDSLRGHRFSARAEKQWEKTRQRGISISPFANPLKRRKGPAGPFRNPLGIPASQPQRGIQRGRARPLGRCGVGLQREGHNRKCPSLCSPFGYFRAIPKVPRPQAKPLFPLCPRIGLPLVCQTKQIINARLIQRCKFDKDFRRDVIFTCFIFGITGL